MKPEAQRIAIAEACGFKPETESTYPHRLMWRGTMYQQWGEQAYTANDLPDYLTDLNACAQMEKVLTNEHVAVYARTLHDVIGLDSKVPPVLWFTVFDYVHATAPQRCEAFLKCIGKWAESTDISSKDFDPATQ